MTVAAPTESAGKLERAVAEAHPWLEALARFGCAAKGFVYGIIGAIALWAALNHENVRAQDQAINQKGILNYFAEQPFGVAVLIALAIGLLGYAIWRILGGLLNPDNKSIWTRLGNLTSGIAYGYLAVLAALVVVGQRANSDEHNGARTILQFPFGQVVLGIVALIVLGVAVGQLWVGATAGFKHIFDLRAMPRWQAVAAIWTGRLGFLARAVLFGIIGGFMLSGALKHDARDAGGVNQAMRTVQHSAGGNALLSALCLGLISYAIFMGCQARYRHIKTADPELVKEVQGDDA